MAVLETTLGRSLEDVEAPSLLLLNLSSRRDLFFFLVQRVQREDNILLRFSEANLLCHLRGKAMPYEQEITQPE